MAQGRMREVVTGALWNLSGVLGGAAVAIGIVAAMAYVFTRRHVPGDAGGRAMMLGFCVFPVLALVCMSAGVGVVRRIRLRRYTRSADARRRTTISR